MTYATQSDLVSRFGERELIEQTDRTTGTNVDAAVVDRELAYASATIDGYLASRYVLPLPEPLPDLLTGVCCDLARYALYTDAAPDIVRDRYRDALALLRDIATGALKLDAATPTAASSGEATVVSYEKLFSRGAR